MQDITATELKTLLDKGEKAVDKANFEALLNRNGMKI